MTATPLPSVLDMAAARSLHADLIDRIDRRCPIALDGAAVTRVGLAGLQVLVAARTAAAGKGIGFAVTDPSAPLAEMAALARLDVIFDSVG